jgi:hypothetical protein
MASARSGPFLGIAKADSPFNILVLAFLVSGLSYLAARVGGVLTLRPQTLCPLWPACALLVSVLLLVPRKIWPVLIPASFAAFVVYDLQTGLSVGSAIWLVLADTVKTGSLAANVLFTPGHTEGSICLYFPVEKKLIAGDTLFAGSIGRTDLPGGSFEKIIKSLHDKLLALPDETVVTPGHGPQTTIGEERENNPFLKN